MSRRRRPGVIGAVMAGLAVATMLAVPGRATADEAGTMRVDPPSLAVDGGETFTFDLVQGAPVATVGAQATIVFDPSIVQVVSAAPGPAYAGGLFLFGSADDGTSASLDATIAAANETGALRNIATFLLPGSGSIPPGETIFLTVTMQGRPGEGGTTGISIQQNNVVDEAGNPLDLVTTTGEVTVGPSATPAPGEETASPAPTATPIPEATPSQPGAAAPPADLAVLPGSLQITAGGQARLFLVARTTVPASSVVATLGFDSTVLEIVRLEQGPAWGEAALLAGGPGQTVDEAIAAANATGVLEQAGVLLLPGTPDLPVGETVFLGVIVRGKVDGTSALTLTGGAALDAQGAEMPINQASAEPGTGAAAGTGGGGKGGTGGSGNGRIGDGGAAAVLIVGLVGGAALLAGVVLVRSGAVPASRMRRWPFAVSLLLGLIPVGMLAALVVMLAANSLPALQDPGLGGLAGAEFSSKYSGINKNLFGLQPALAGTLLIAGVALAIALPVSLALAIVATEFPMGPVGRLVRPLVGVLAGIPPIVYAVSALAFVAAFMIPKFAADSTFATFDPARLGVRPEDWPPGDVPFSSGSYPWDLTGTNNSTLLGGILIALLVIPFMTPLITDAMRNVPSAAREASYALGANRGYTLRRVILPHALPGVVAAVALGTLKALGDTLIVAFAVGWQADTVPDPLLDVLERTPSLATQGAGLIGSFPTIGGSCTPTQCAVGYSSALLLLLLAIAVVVGASYVQARLRRRMAA